MPQATGLQFTARVGDLPPDHFAVVGFELTERLSDLADGRLELASRDPAVAPETVLEQPVELVLWQDGQPRRRFTGVVNEFARGDTGHRRTRYQLRFQPPLWRLGLMHNSRIFQGQGSDAILGTLLAERGLVDPSFDLRQPVPEREYCVQHRESDLAFLERLAAEEGWHYRYHHGDLDGTPPMLIFADHHGHAPRLAPASYNARTGGAWPHPGVDRFRVQERVRVASVALKDYTFHNPAYALLHEQTDPSPRHRDDYQHYDYPGRFKRDDRGRVFSRRRLEALRNDACVAEGRSRRPDFTAGARVALTEHDRPECNRDWLLVAVRHQGQQPQALEEEGGAGATRYHNRFEAVPAEVPWRPRPRPRPVMDGPQVARVTGPEGEEIHCDAHGRVKVRFPWDRYSRNDEHSSAWLRVSQGWAGGQYGFLALPRIGHEVIVSFLDGDPDQPIITGCTYHAGHPPPYPLPEHKTRTVLRSKSHKGEGNNELSFEDESGREQVYLHAQRDLVLDTGHDRTECIGHDSHLTVANHARSLIKGAEHQTTEGEQRVSVGADCSWISQGSWHQQTGGVTASEAGTEVHYQAGNQVVLDAGVELTLCGGGSFLKLDPSGVTLSGPGIRINSGGGPGSAPRAQPQSPETPVPVKPVASAGVVGQPLAETRDPTISSGPSASRETVRLVDVRGRGSDRELITAGSVSAKEGSE
ncbi:MAG: type VI secretion system tip protein VgrG [Oceanospirillales bacterium]|nr:type VI secretion system tip protein VgrG [Oceanospirillales bacterium]